MLASVISLVAFGVLFTTNLSAQAPEKMSYQAVIRNNSGQLVTNKQVRMRVSILQGSASGTSVFTQTLTPTTNTNGLAGFEIGGAGFSSIDWASGPYYIKTECDPDGGTSYTITGTSQVLSVPYALHAKTAGAVAGNSTWQTSGNNIYFSGGKVGIGVSNPQSTLDMNGILQLRGTAGDAEPKALKFGPDYTNLNSYMFVAGDNEAGIEISNNGYWTGSAQVDVNFTRPRSGLAIGRSDYALYLWTSETDGSEHINSSRKIAIEYNGNVGIGTDHPVSKLDVNGIINLNNHAITNLATPVNASDAATKAYVDALLMQIEALKVQIEPYLLANGFTDPRDGNHYDVVKIGDQVWMAENLKYLPMVAGPGSGSSTLPYYYVYGYSGTSVADAKATANYATYGVLYNWAAAMAGSASSTINPSGVQGVCPVGWHLPGRAEWTQLTDYLGGEMSAGGKLKEAGTTHWNSPNTGATDEAGFTALPGGFIFVGGLIQDLGYVGYWWCAEEYNSENAYYRAMSSSNTSVISSNGMKWYGYSVRCVRD